MDRPAYSYKTEPKGKQRDVIEASWRERKWAFLCRPGTGKTKIGLDTAGLLYAAGEIDALVVIAPNGVHRQWVDEGIPVHLPESIPWKGGAYSSGIGIRAMDKLTRALATRDMALRVLTLSFEGVQTKKGGELAHALMNAYRTLLIIDESHWVSNTKSAGWRAVLKLAALAKYRRISTGTLLRQNPFTAFGQFELLQHGLLGYQSLSSFKSMYAEMLPPDNGLVKKIADDFKKKTGKTIVPQIIAKDTEDRPIYRNLEHLRRRVMEWSSFLSLADLDGKEPEVLLSTRYVQLTLEQRTFYDQLTSLGVVEHNDGLLTADSGLALATRLCQVVGGFAPNDDDPNATPVCDINPKLNELMDILEELGPLEKVVIWCKFTAEILAVTSALAERYGLNSLVPYHGSVSGRDRTENKARFINDPDCRFFVGQIKAGGTGLDGLQRVSSYMIFYSNDYSYTDREQAIARLARTAGALTVNVVDIMAENSVDEDVVRCMQTAQDVHEKVLLRRIAGAAVAV